MKPASGEALLLLGLHLEDVEGYFPMFDSEGKPHTNVAPGYRTVLVHTKDGTVTIEAELPYLTLPQEKGLLYVGESSVSIHEPMNPADTNAIGVPRPHDYDATKLWTTTSRSKVDSTLKTLEKSLRAKKEWGKENTEQLLYLTPRARCRSVTWTEWTGGAAWFDGQMSYQLDAVSGPKLDDKLAAHVDDATLKRFAQLAFDAKEEELDPDFDLDAPQEDWGNEIHFRKDSHVCLAHLDGETKLVGTLLRAGNAHRSFTVAIPLQAAPVDWAPSNAYTVDFKSIAAAFPGATDAFPSPTHDTLLVVQDDKLVLLDALSKKASDPRPFKGRVVMAEWLTGDRMTATLAELTK